MEPFPFFSLDLAQDEFESGEEAVIVKVDHHNGSGDEAGEIATAKGKKVKDVASTSRSPSRKRHASRNSKAHSSLSARPPLPKGMSYVIKSIPKHFLKFGFSYNCNFADDIKFSIGDDFVVKFWETIFGHFLDIPPCKFQGQNIKCIILNEVKHKDIDI